MPNRLRISLVIPAYNEESHLYECLCSALDQMVPFHEIIVVDNNSSDATARIVGGFPGVRLIREGRQGVTFARSRGFDAVRGDIIARIDADVVLPETWVEHVQSFYGRPAHLTHAWTGGGYFYNVRAPKLVSGVYNLLAFRANQVLIGYPSLWGSNMAMPKEMWQTVANELCARGGIHEDLDLATHLHQEGYSITYDPTLQISAQLRRVRSNRQDLWEYLQWWPRTLRMHGQRTWILCWLVGVLPLYFGAFLLGASEHVARLVGYEPLRDDTQVSALDV